MHELDSRMHTMWNIVDPDIIYIWQKCEGRGGILTYPDAALFFSKKNNNKSITT